jgi:hypothetical protein
VRLRRESPTSETRKPQPPKREFTAMRLELLRIATKPAVACTWGEDMHEAWNTIRKKAAEFVHRYLQKKSVLM